MLLDGKEVFRVPWGYKTFTPAFRAEHISQRLKRLGDDPSAPRLSVQPEDAIVDVMAGDTLIATVFDGDAKAAATSKEALARQWASAMQRSVDAYRLEHSLRLKSTRIALALLIILVCTVLLVLFHLAARTLADRATAKLRDRASHADRRVALFLAHEQTRNIVNHAFSLGHFILSLGVLWFSLRLVLGIFPGTRSLAEKMHEKVLRPIHAFDTAFLESLPSLIFVLLVAVVAWYAIKVARYFFSRVREGDITIEGFRPIWAGTTERLVTITLVILAVLVAFPYIPGSQSPAFKGISLFLGVLVSLGSTGLVANVVTGVALTYIDAFEPGDLVKIGEVVGFVTKMGVLTTRVRTRKNEIITFPNSVVVSREIVNFSKPGEKGLIVSSKAGIGYDAPWRQVEGMLKLAAGRTRGIRVSPQPFVLELSLNTFDITYELNAHMEAGELPYVVLAELNRNILDAFNEFGVQIMTPAYVADPQGAKVVPREQWSMPPASPVDNGTRTRGPDADTGGSKAAD